MVLHLAPDLAARGEWQAQCHDPSFALSHVGPTTLAGDTNLNTAACCPSHRELPIAPETELHKPSHCALHFESFRHHARSHAPCVLCRTPTVSLRVACSCAATA